MSTFNAPDLQAPRFRNKVLNLLNGKMFDAFIKKHPNYKGTLDLKTFKEVVTVFNGNIKEAVVDFRDGVELPQNLGYLLVAKCDKPKNKENLDYAASIKYGKTVTHRNWESDNFLAKICYSNYSLKYRFADRELWGFKPAKTFRQNVSKTFPENYQRYLHLTDKTKLSKLYKNI